MNKRQRVAEPPPSGMMPGELLVKLLLKRSDVMKDAPDPLQLAHYWELGAFYCIPGNSELYKVSKSFLSRGEFVKLTNAQITAIFCGEKPKGYLPGTAVRFGSKQPNPATDGGGEKFMNNLSNRPIRRSSDNMAKADRDVLGPNSKATKGQKLKAMNNSSECQSMHHAPDSRSRAVNLNATDGFPFPTCFACLGHLGNNEPISHLPGMSSLIKINDIPLGLGAWIPGTLPVLSIEGSVGTIALQEMYRNAARVPTLSSFSKSEVAALGVAAMSMPGSIPYMWGSFSIRRLCLGQWLPVYAMKTVERRTYPGKPSTSSSMYTGVYEFGAIKVDGGFARSGLIFHARDGPAKITPHFIRTPKHLVSGPFAELCGHIFLPNKSSIGFAIKVVVGPSGSEGRSCQTTTPLANKLVFNPGKDASSPAECSGVGCTDFATRGSSACKAHRLGCRVRHCSAPGRVGGYCDEHDGTLSIDSDDIVDAHTTTLAYMALALRHLKIATAYKLDKYVARQRKVARAKKKGHLSDADLAEYQADQEARIRQMPLTIHVTFVGNPLAPPEPPHSPRVMAALHAYWRAHDMEPQVSRPNNTAFQWLVGVAAGGSPRVTFLFHDLFTPLAMLGSTKGEVDGYRAVPPGDRTQTLVQQAAGIAAARCLADFGGEDALAQAPFVLFDDDDY